MLKHAGRTRLKRFSKGIFTVYHALHYSAHIHRAGARLAWVIAKCWHVGSQLELGVGTNGETGVTEGGRKSRGLRNFAGRG